MAMVLAVLFSFWFGGFVMALAWTVHDLMLHPKQIEVVLQFHHPAKLYACLVIALAFWMFIVPWQLAQLSRSGEP